MQAGNGGQASSTESFLKPLHVDTLYPGDIKLLSNPFQVFTFDFSDPPMEDRQQLLQVDFPSFKLINGMRISYINSIEHLKFQCVLWLSQTAANHNIIGFDSIDE